MGNARVRRGLASALPAAQHRVRASATDDHGRGAAPAGGYSETFLGGLRWRSIGPARGGRSTAAAGSDARPLEYYFGTTGGGLWKTTDGGTTWTPITDKALKTSSVGAVAVAPSNPDVVYIGMGESQLRGNIIQGDGVYKTTDAARPGRTWGSPKTMVVSRIRVHPTNPDVVFAAALGHPYASDAGSRRVPLERWRQDLGARAVPRREDRRGRSGDRSEESGRPLRGAVGGVPHAAFAVERRTGQRPVQVDRRRRDLDGDHAQAGAAEGPDRQDRRVGVGRGLEPRLRDRRSGGRRRVLVGRRRRDLDAGERPIAGCASARSTTRASTPIRRRRTRSTC